MTENSNAQAEHYLIAHLQLGDAEGSGKQTVLPFCQQDMKDCLQTDMKDFSAAENSLVTEVLIQIAE